MKSDPQYVAMAAELAPCSGTVWVDSFLHYCENGKHAQGCNAELQPAIAARLQSVALASHNAAVEKAAAYHEKRALELEKLQAQDGKPVKEIDQIIYRHREIYARDISALALPTTDREQG